MDHPVRFSFRPAHSSVRAFLCAAALLGGERTTAANALRPEQALLERHCLGCHDDVEKKGDLSLERLVGSDTAAHAELWEKVLRRVGSGQMPPPEKTQPSVEELRGALGALTTTLDQAAQRRPNPGRTDSLRRLNRTEYHNAVRDLLAVEIDATALLPHDEPSHGFDNVTVANLSPALLDRYVGAAQKIARLAVGSPLKAPTGETFRIKPDVSQENHIDGLPLGTRGGGLFHYAFPQDGTYEVQVRLARDRNEQVEGLRRPHDVEVLIDRERVALATVKPPGADKNAEAVDAHLKFRISVRAGDREIGVTFPRVANPLIETERQPFIARFNMHRHPRTVPAIYQVTVTGPLAAAAAPPQTASRRRLFGPAARPDLPAAASAEQEQAAATRILLPLVRRAYRRTVGDEDLGRILRFFTEARSSGGDFEAGIESALSALLVSPQFLFRVERDPPEATAGAVYRIGAFELASRLSFFLWSSLPDDELLDVAAAGRLAEPDVLAAQARRLLADPRASHLVSNFAVQWLHLRSLEGLTPDSRLFPDFDDNLRQALRQETELFVAEVIREDQPLTTLLHADYTYLNDRLAWHYGIPHVAGSHFRRIAFPAGEARQRGGLLRHGSILTLTSYATRTSPVIRGNWILQNFVGTPPPPPPPNVPSLDNGVISASLPIRERLAAHRAQPACAGCHNLMDPIGFALENYDAVGRWRIAEDKLPVDASGGLPDGSRFVGVAALEKALLQRPELFAGTLAEKLLTFALGRGVAPYDAPAIRQMVRRAQAEEYRFSALIVGLVQSTPFQMRKAP